MRRYRNFFDLYQQGGPRREATLDMLVGALDKALVDSPGTIALEGRIKGPLSTYRKMRRYGIDFEEVHDLLGIRMIVSSISQCYEALELTRELWPHQWNRVKDYIAQPKPNGYQSLHVWLELDEAPLLELQIRTQRMHERCMSGAAAHHRYKQNLEAHTPSDGAGYAHH